MKSTIKNIKYIITVLLFTVSCQLSEDLMDAMNEYNTDALLTVTVSPGAAAVYNNDAMVVTCTPSEPEFTIRYTTDSSDPSRTAGSEYTAPFPIDTASGFTAGIIEIRIVAYDENKISNVVSRTVVLGDGLTAATSFEIATALQLATAAANVNNGTHANASFRQVADIDLISYAAGSGWEPIGNITFPFTGNYNGGNFTISNLTINSPTNNQGLFGNVAGNASLQNITLSDVNITGWGSTGALAGDVNGTGITISNCDVTGTSQVFGVTLIGGLIGNCNNATITDCSITATVAGTTDYIGGLAGYVSSTDVTGCNTDVTVTGINYIGGLIGYAERTVLKTILRCTSAGTVTGENGVGGLVGITGRDATNKGVLIDDSLSAATVEGTALVFSAGDILGVGGLVGALLYGGEITNCRAYGDVTNAANPGETRETGGLVGAIVYSGSTVTNSHSEGDVSAPNALRVGGFVGFNQNTSIIGTDNYSTGDVTGRDNVGGFVGYNNSTILSGNYATGDVTGRSIVGGFSGWNARPITGCWHTTGTITGTVSSIGGFSGNNAGAGAIITDCYARGNVQSSGGNYGGFVGTNSSGIITNCYSTGNVSVTGSNYGGFTGNDTTGTYTACFWVKDASLPINASVINDAGNPANLTNVTDNLQSAMYTSALYTAAGWDLATIWNITDGSSYPFLR